MSNPHTEDIVFDNLDIQDRFFGAFEVVSISPAAPYDCPVGGFSTQTWHYGTTVIKTPHSVLSPMRALEGQ